MPASLWESDADTLVCLLGLSGTRAGWKARITLNKPSVLRSRLLRRMNHQLLPRLPATRSESGANILVCLRGQDKALGGEGADEAENWVSAELIGWKVAFEGQGRVGSGRSAWTSSACGRHINAPGTVYPSSSKLAYLLFSCLLDGLSEGILGSLVSNRFGQSV